MPITPKKEIRLEICEVVEQQVLDLLNANKFSLKELVYLLGKIIIDFGAALEHITEPIQADKAWEAYTKNPTVGNAMISAGIDMHRWLDL